MQMNEIIRERRLSQKLTQEQVARCLGVSAPAVNKWEKGVSYPDITLLPALARLLKTDLNTLLSFQEDLSETEIAFFLNELEKQSKTEGFQKIVECAMEKIREYPFCYPLILNVALFLEGSLMLDQSSKKEAENYKELLMSLYQRATESEDMKIRNQAQSMLISRYMEQKDYEKVQELMESLPESSFYVSDKRQIQIKLHIAREEYDEAAKLEEERIMQTANAMQSMLLTLMELAMKESRFEDAEYIADVSKKTAEIFDLWEYNSYVAHFQLYSETKQKMKCLRELIPMLRALTKKWEINRSPLYHHIKTKETEGEFGEKMKQMVIGELRRDKEMKFLTESAEFQEMIKAQNR